MDEMLKKLQISSLLYGLYAIVSAAEYYSDTSRNLAWEYLKEHAPSLLAYRLVEASSVDAGTSNPFQTLQQMMHAAHCIASGDASFQISDGSNTYAPLASIFNRVNTHKNADKKVLYPGDTVSDMPTVENKPLHKEHFRQALSVLEQAAQIGDAPELICVALEKAFAKLPQSGYGSDSAISYYDHHRISTAIATCLYLYDKETGIEDFESEYRGDFRTKDKFLIASGEFSGIQNFIYTISSKMAMKSLRGRSFYLELFIEHIIDELLEQLGLSRINLMYSGGSHFYLLLPNIPAVRSALQKCKDVVNNYLLQEMGASVYFELVSTSSTPEELGNGLSLKEKNENLIGDIFRRISRASSQGKTKRYGKEQLMQLFDENSSVNKVLNHSKECVICRKSETENILLSNAKETAFGELALCDSCKHFIALGAEIAKLYHNDTDFIAVTADDTESGLCLPSFAGTKLHVCGMDESALARAQKSGKLRRYYAINQLALRDVLCRNIFIGNYNIKGENQQLIEFSKLVKRAKGISRLAVLRADVDNLGTLFQQGFADNSSKNPYQHLNISTSAVLSRYLSDFFKNKINNLLEKPSTATLIGSSDGMEQRPRDIIIVYSGGDDLFAIGTWNDMIAFAMDLSRTFQAITSGKITLSAGIGFFSEGYPIHQMAEQTGGLEKLAKGYTAPGENTPTKNALALFGEMPQRELNHVYPWEEFISGVVGEKYQYLKSVSSIDETPETEKLVIGKSQWYRMMDLIESVLTGQDKRLDLARFAYVLARIKHTKQSDDNYRNLKTQLLGWLKNKKDAKQLYTAINILIYEKRGE